MGNQILALYGCGEFLHFFKYNSVTVFKRVAHCYWSNELTLKSELKTAP